MAHLKKKQHPSFGSHRNRQRKSVYRRRFPLSGKKTLTADVNPGEDLIERFGCVCSYLHRRIEDPISRDRERGDNGGCLVPTFSPPLGKKNELTQSTETIAWSVWDVFREVFMSWSVMITSGGVKKKMEHGVRRCDCDAR